MNDGIIQNAIGLGDVVIAASQPGGFHNALVVGVNGIYTDLLFEDGTLGRAWPIAYLTRVQSYAGAPKEL